MYYFQERESLNHNIVNSINQAAEDWGIKCLRYEIKDIHVPPRVKESMQMQARTSSHRSLCGLYSARDKEGDRYSCRDVSVTVATEGFIF